MKSANILSQFAVNPFIKFNQNISLLRDFSFRSFIKKLELFKFKKEVIFTGTVVLTLSGSTYIGIKWRNKLEKTKTNHLKTFFCDIIDKTLSHTIKNDNNMFNILSKIKQLKKIIKRNENSPAMEKETIYNNKPTFAGLLNLSRNNLFYGISKAVSSSQNRTLTSPVPIIDKANSEHTNLVIDVSSDNFEEIINKSSDKNPLLLMYYERNCIMCFLMRPFINTLAQKLDKANIVKFARIDIDKNINLPHVSATPTFVIYYGKDSFIKWDKYKPSELLDLLFKEIQRICKSDNRELYNELMILEQQIYLRFQLFCLLIVWKTYLIEIENLFRERKRNKNEDIIKKSKKLQDMTLKFLSVSETNSRNETYGLHVDSENILKEIEIKHSVLEKLFSSSISKDMERSDTLEENICYIKNELKEIMIDCNILIRIMEKSGY